MREYLLQEGKKSYEDFTWAKIKFIIKINPDVITSGNQRERAAILCVTDEDSEQEGSLPGPIAAKDRAASTCQGAC